MILRGKLKKGMLTSRVHLTSGRSDTLGKKTITLGRSLVVTEDVDEELTGDSYMANNSSRSAEGKVDWLFVVERGIQRR